MRLTLTSDCVTTESHAFAADDTSKLDQLAADLTADIIEASEAQAICDLMSEMLTRKASSAIVGALVERWITDLD